MTAHAGGEEMISPGAHGIALSILRMSLSERRFPRLDIERDDHPSLNRHPALLSV